MKISLKFDEHKKGGYAHIPKGLFFATPLLDVGGMRNLALGSQAVFRSDLSAREKAR